MASLSDALPCAVMFPHLTAMQLEAGTCDTASVHQLGMLAQLQELRLRLSVREHQQPEQQLALPRLAAVTALDLELSGGNVTLHMDLSNLPSLQQLQLVSFGCSVDVTAGDSEPGVPASRLKEMDIWAEQAVVDFSAMPALRRVYLDVDHLEEAASIAAAGALQAVALG